MTSILTLLVVTSNPNCVLTVLIVFFQRRGV